MKQYSPFFSTLHDEDGPVGHLGGGTHYSVLRAVLWEPEPAFHDFAVVWDEDHDLRVVWVLEQMLTHPRVATQADPDEDPLQESPLYDWFR